MTDDPKSYVTEEGAAAIKTNVVKLRRWTPPKPLPSQLQPVAAFDPNLLPETLRDYAVDIADLMQCPIDYTAVSLMVAAASVVGRKVAIRPKQRGNWAEVANLWGCLVGRPGVMKSPSMKQALTPLRRLEAELGKENKEAEANYKIDLELHKIQAEALKAAAKQKAKAGEKISRDDLSGGEPPGAPGEKRLLVNDVTYEALGEILQKNENGVLYFRDELVSMLRPLDREEKAADRGFMMAAWNGTDSYAFDRIGRGNITIKACCISVLGSTQPGRLASYLQDAVKGGGGDDGMAQRFSLLVWPDVSPDWEDVDRYPDGPSRRAVNIMFDRLAAFSADTVDAERDEFDPLPYLRFAGDASEAFKAWHTQHERRVRSGELHPSLEGHLGKYRGLVPKLALLAHLIEGKAGPVRLNSVGMAIGWVDYLETHARRAYASVTAAHVAGANTIIQKLREGKLTSPFTPRDVHQADWAGLTDKVDVAEALGMLVDFDWLDAERVETGGRPKTLYTFNPLGAVA